MATDAVIQFKYSDGVHLALIYKRYDSSVKDIIKSLKKYLATTKNKQWGFIVADIISRFVEDSGDRKGVKMLHKLPSEDDNSFIHFWEIYPKEEDYRNEAIPFEKSVQCKIWAGNKKELIYQGSISDFWDMKATLKSLGWNEFYPETMKRIFFFKDGFRECFSNTEISDEDLEEAVAYAFGIYGQEMVYGIYSMLQRELVDGKTMNTVVKNFIKAFEETLSETTVEALKPKHYINLFIELLYSFVIKGK